MLVKVSTPEAIGCAAPCHTRGLLRCSYSYLVCMTTTLLLQLLRGVSYAAAVNCCHNTSLHNVMPQVRLRGTRLAPPPNPSTAPASFAQPNPRTLQQSVTGTRVQSVPSARFAITSNTPVLFLARHTLTFSLTWMSTCTKGREDRLPSLSHSCGSNLMPSILV